MKRAFLLLLVLYHCGLHAQVFTMLKDIAPGTAGSNGLHYYFCVYNGRVYFRANDNSVINNWELWSTDGTPGGTSLVKEIDPSIGSNPNYMTVVNGKILFAANDPIASYEFFSSDGTTGGTSLLKDIDPGTTSGFANASFPTNFSVMNGMLYFSAKQVGTGTEIWQSDGTAAGTVMIKEINPGAANGVASIAPTGNTLNGFLFFSATDGLSGTELWKTDGSAGGTSLVKDINPGSGASNPTYYFGIMNNELYFAATTAANGTELWKTDGTAAGTVLVKDINPGNGSALQSTTSAAWLNGFLYFPANDGTNGSELWRSDGTAAGTVMVKDINPGAAAGGGFLPVTAGGLVYFIGNDGVNGSELWKTDGTAAGTVLLKDINPGSASSSPGNLTNIGGILLFNATTAANGAEPWRTDGSTANTVMIEDVAPGAASSQPGEYHEYNGLVYTTMTTPAYGNELWVASLPVVIPLRLLEFKGALVNGYAQLNWKTAEELNTRSFVIEKSKNGNFFEEAGVVSAINRTGIQYYAFTDKNPAGPATPKMYYRLKQIDIDGRFTYSPVVLLQYPAGSLAASIHPNPAGDNVTVNITAEHVQQITLKIFNVSGQLLRQQLLMAERGITNLDINTGAWPSGIYRFSIETDESRQVLSLVKR